ncbi:MAG: iron ABC transporter permease [Planctomycetota bacterium]|nr:MAG: iron ABC transporter permease [Planctomycetota bacterium]
MTMGTIAVYGLLFSGLALTVLASLVFGAGSLRDDALASVFLSLRAQRLAAAAVVGAGLAVSGVLLQGLFRNPLADPGIIGTSAGAVLGGMVMVFVAALAPALLPLPPALLLPLGAILGAMLSLALLLAVAKRCRDTTSVLLCGVVLAMFLAAIGAGLSAWAQGYWELSRALMAFSLGGIEGKGWSQVAVAAPLVVAPLLAAWLWWSRQLDVLLSGEDEATSLGVDLARLRRWMIIWATLAVAGAVAIGGAIAFVGLIVPHLLRSWMGPAHRLLLPAAALGGMLFVMLCDLLLRLIPAANPVPLGVVTGLLGAPLFVVLLLRSRRELWT